MGSAESLQNVAKVVERVYNSDTPCVLVCSAMSGITNKLIEMGGLAQQRKEDDALKIYIQIRLKHFGLTLPLIVPSQYMRNMDS